MRVVFAFGREELLFFNATNKIMRNSDKLNLSKILAADIQKITQFSFWLS
jgi:hypothetical protein